MTYFHRLDGRDPASLPPPLPPGPVLERAADETCHSVYAALLAALSLSSTHRANLEARGLSAAEIDARGYRTLPKEGRSRLARALRDRFGDAVLRVPGFFVKEGERGHYLTLAGRPGLLIPSRDRAGKIQALRIRPDEGPAKYVWFSSSNRGGASPGAPIHVPHGVPSSAPIVRLTEGELKADVAFALSGVPTIALPGVGLWKEALAVLKGFGAAAVRLAFDADARRKKEVAIALDNAAAGLLAEGLEVELEAWAEDYKGIDDALAGGAAIELVPAAQARQAIAAIVTSGAGGDGGPPKIMQGDAFEGDDALPEKDEAYKPLWRPFPVHTLPLLVGNFVEAISESIQVDPTMVAIPALAAIAGAIGNSRVIRLKRTWTEPAIVFGCVIAEPGSRKSAAMDWAVAPVKRWNAVKLREHRVAMEQHKADFEQWAAMSAAKEKDTPGAGATKKPEPPIKRRGLVVDITVETLIRELQNNPRGLLIPRDELRGWFASFGKYAKSGAGSDECFWLEVRGQEYHYDRKTGDHTSVSIPHLTLSVVGTTQPEIWRGLAVDAMFHSGMVPRILLAYPPKRLGRFHSDEPPEDVLRHYDHLLHELLDLDYQRTLDPDWHPLPMTFTGEAANRFSAWCDEGRRQQFQADGDVAAMLGKMEAYCARFALIFAVCDRVMGGLEDLVEDCHVKNAIELADWFREEALRVYWYTREKQADANVTALLQKVAQNGGKMTPHALWKGNKIRWKSTVAARGMLEQLADQGLLIRGPRHTYLLPAEAMGGGGKNGPA